MQPSLSHTFSSSKTPPAVQSHASLQKQRIHRPWDGRRSVTEPGMKPGGRLEAVPKNWNLRVLGNECFMAHQSAFDHFLEKDDATFKKTKFLLLMVEWAIARTVKMHHLWYEEILNLLHPGKWLILGKSRASALMNDFWKPSWKQNVTAHGTAQHQSAAELLKCSSQRDSNTPSLLSPPAPACSHQVRTGPCQQPPGHIIDNVTMSSSNSSAGCTRQPQCPPCP